MATINKTKSTAVRKDSHKNFMAGTSFDITPLVRLRAMAASCFFGEPKYYTSSGSGKKKSFDEARKSSTLSDTQIKYLRESLDAIDKYDWRSLKPTELMERAIDEALAFDPEGTLYIAAALRNEDKIRVTPQVIMVRAANHLKVKGTGLIRKYAPSILRRMDEPATQLAYQLKAFGKPVPNSLKRSWADRFLIAKKYELAKYRMESREVKTVDVINMIDFQWNDDIRALVGGELKLNDETWEALRSKGESWDKCLGVMGHFAIVKNLRNLITADVDQDLIVDKMTKSAERGMLLPFRYWTAYMAVKNAHPTGSAKILDALEDSLMKSMPELPQLPGKSLILTDNSGSAYDSGPGEYSSVTVAEIGNMMGILTGMISDEGVIGVFGDRLKYHDVRKRSSVFDQLKEVNKIGVSIGHGTEHGIWLALDEITQKEIHYDNLFVYSDMQAGHGGLYGSDKSSYSDFIFPNSGQYIDVPKLVNRYRTKVNPNINVFLVQTAGYQDTIIPEYYRRTFILGGWSHSVLMFARKMIDISNQIETQQS